jgi:hypothetical protein
MQTFLSQTREKERCNITVPLHITSCSLGSKSEITFCARSFGKEDVAG